MRAAMKGLADAVADPTAASTSRSASSTPTATRCSCRPRASAHGGRSSRGWSSSTNAATALGVPEPELLTNEVTTYAGIGLFGGDAPTSTPYVDIDLISGVYDDDRAVIWPAPADAATGAVRSGVEHAAGVLDVVVQLRLQRVDAVELALAAQEVRELDAGVLAVQVAVEVDAGALRAASGRRARRTSADGRG